MTRPMPGPPECTPDGSPHESVPYNGGGFLRCHRHDPTRRYRKSKRLTAEGCAAHYWQAFCYRARALAEIINLPPHEARRIVKESDTWHRFDTHHHALEES